MLKIKWEWGFFGGFLLGYSEILATYLALLDCNIILKIRILARVPSSPSHFNLKRHITGTVRESVHPRYGGYANLFNNKLANCSLL